MDCPGPKSKVLKKTTCQHLEQFKKNGGVKNYAKIHANLVTCVVDRSRDLKARLSKCFTCRRVDGFLHTCMHCIYFGCLKGGHIKNHYKETGHTLACDLTFGNVYCFKCTDFLYDKDLEAIALANEQKLDHVLWMPWNSRTNGAPLAEFYLRWGAPKRFCVAPKSTYGLRGLVNLGHTCYMNSIVQTLIHTPLLRDFFMTERIVCNQKHDAEASKPCIITLLFDIFQEFYNGSKTAVTLQDLLHKVWGNAKHLAGYDQHDAHEFFIAVLDALHLHFFVKDTGPCKCIVDVLFHGKFHSLLTCLSCGHQSITVDPYWDVSLDIIGGGRGGVDVTDPKAIITLDECLRRYTTLENVGMSAADCKDCKDKTPITKQLKFLTLPVVLSFHLKRFVERGVEHNKTNYKKIDNCVRFTERLDLAPYLCHYEEKKKNAPIMEQLYNQIKASDYKYSLFAVVNHIGSLEGGHYYAFVRHTRDTWYKCDDHMITKATKEEVLSSPGYLLFYHKETLFYDNGDNDEDVIPCSSSC